jgi:hypothetical protein
MTRATFTIAAIAFLCSTAAATSPKVTFVSPCSCHGSHRKGRWAQKNDASLPPADAHAVHAVTPSDIFNWKGPTAHLTRRSKRIVAENSWFALTGRVIDLKVEADGDIHIALKDATGNKRELLELKCPRKLNGAPFGKKSLVGHQRNSLFRSGLTELSRSANPVSLPLSGKLSSTSIMLPRIIQTGGRIFRAMLPGKFILS